MRETLARVGIIATRTRGMLPTEFQVPKRKVQVMQNRTPGAIGCYASQYNVMCETLRQGKHAFVMEDDLVFCEDFHKRMEYMTCFFETHTWDVLWLGGTFHVNPPYWHTQDLRRDAECTDDPRVMRTYGAFSTHAYIVNKNSLQRILILLDDWMERSMGIDWSFIQFQPSIYAYAFVPGCVIQYDNQSDIGRGMTRFSGFAKLGPYWFQPKMEDFDPEKFDWHEAHRRI